MSSAAVVIGALTIEESVMRKCIFRRVLKIKSFSFGLLVKGYYFLSEIRRLPCDGYILGKCKGM